MKKQFIRIIQSCQVTRLAVLVAGIATLVPTTVVAQNEASWESLMLVDYKEVETENGRKWVPQFSPDVRKMENEAVRVSGYMIPLGFAEKQNQFLISALPGDGCYFHLPGGANSVILVEAQTGVDFTYETIAIEGKLELLRDDPYGLLYRMVDARPSR